MVGCLLTGIFADAKIGGVDGAYQGRGVLVGYQILSIVICASYSFGGTFAILYALKYTIGLRVPDDQEKLGIDVAVHKSTAYESGASGPRILLLMTHHGLNISNHLHKRETTTTKTQTMMLLFPRHLYDKNNKDYVFPLIKFY
eukprot:PhF_6_TR23298/c0_g1_i5/m.32876/K03320/amt, AMT, MEP; ammonium transporter, Amt family